MSLLEHKCLVDSVPQRVKTLIVQKTTHICTEYSTMICTMLAPGELDRLAQLASVVLFLRLGAQ